MAEDIKDGAAADNAGAAQATELANVKAEMNRKMSNLEAANTALLQQLQQIVRKPEPAKAAPIDPFENPAGYAAAIRDEAKAEAKKEIFAELDVRAADKQRMDGTINALYKEFPELASSDHEFTKAALSKYEAMSEADRKDPRSLKLAATETALEMGIKPARLRSEDDESFSMPTGSYGQGNRPNRKSSKVDPRVMDFAARIGAAGGLDLSDPKVVARIEKRARGEKP